MEPEGLDAPVDERTLEIDLLIDQAREMASTVGKLVELLKQSGNSNTTTTHVIHKTEGVGIWSGVVILIQILFAIWINIEFGRQNKVAITDSEKTWAELHDLRAWEQIHQNHINALEAKEKK